MVAGGLAETGLAPVLRSQLIPAGSVGPFARSPLRVGVNALLAFRSPDQDGRGTLVFGDPHRDTAPDTFALGLH